jgi:hypothetical protein
VRFERTERFKADYRRLSDADRAAFRKAVREFNEACDRFTETLDPAVWPARLRVKAVVNAPGVFEMTWSFSGPDGRATWEWMTITDSEGHEHPAVRWRRLGDHESSASPEPAKAPCSSHEVFPISLVGPVNRLPDLAWPAGAIRSTVSPWRQTT